MTRRPPAALEVHSVSHRYPGSDRLALDDVSFGVEPGTRVGLLGPNGAGKTTLMRLVCGYLALAGDDARLRVGGHDVREDSLAVRTLVGYMPEQVPLYAELRVREHLTFRARIKRVPRRERGAEIDRAAALTGLGDELDVPIFKLSRGYRQRVGLADALLGRPPLLVLDEPTVGLDPNQVLDVRLMLRELGTHQTLVFSSHILAEVEQLCDRVVILSEGRVVADESVDEAMRAGPIVAEWEAELDAVEAVVEAAAAALEVDEWAERALEHDGRLVRARLGLRPETDRDGDQSAALLAALGRASAERRLTLVRLEPGRRRLEERFARVTGSVRSGPGDAP